MKSEVTSRLSQLVGQFQQMSKIQLSKNAQSIVAENQKLIRRSKDENRKMNLILTNEKVVKKIIKRQIEMNHTFQAGLKNKKNDS